MTVGDFLAQTSHRYRTQGPIRATSAMLWDAYVGLLWKAMRARQTSVMQTSLCGETVRFHCHETQDVQRALTLNHERPIAEWLLDGVDDDTTFWDVGSFHGHYAILAALKGADVTAFEPNPDNISRIHDNLDANDVSVTSVAIAPVALSSTSRNGTIDTDANMTSVTSDGGRDVGLVAGDEWGTPPDVVKIDTEGHELAVLEGMEVTLRDVSRIVVEVHDETNPVDVMSRLRDAGLTVGTVPSRRDKTYVTGTR